MSLSKALAAILFIAGSAMAVPTKAQCAGQQVLAAGDHLWVGMQGEGPVTVAFEAGNGSDSTVWSAIAATVRAGGVRTLVYDRAGLGRSDLPSAPYSIDQVSRAFRGVLDACHVVGPVVLVTHSYGGFISLLTASQDQRVSGLVMVDANVPAFFDKAQLDAILAQYRPQYAELRAKAPTLAISMIPLMEAYPASARRLRQMRVPQKLPIIDIVAEHSWAATPEAAAAMRKAHADFVAASPARSAVFAAGSSHNVMRDKPEIVIAAIQRMIALVGKSAR
jgi:pimeloyl-ACP methyl ester carboxylesterase